MHIINCILKESSLLLTSQVFKSCCQASSSCVVVSGDFIADVVSPGINIGVRSILGSSNKGTNEHMGIGTAGLEGSPVTGSIGWAVRGGVMGSLGVVLAVANNKAGK